MEYTGIETSVPKKGKKVIRTLGLIFLVIMMIWTIIYFFPTTEREEHAFFQKDEPLVIAHQGGEHLAPSSTMESFTQAKELGVDVIEFDVHMTNDGHLVAIHDNTVDRTTDGSGKVNDLTLSEIKQMDAGNYFKDINGEYSFRRQGVVIPTVEEIFEAIPDILWNIEVKATNNPELYETISEKLWAIIQEYELEEKVLFASFDQNIIDIVTDISKGHALVSGGRQEVTKFVVFHKFFLNGLYRSKVDAVQIPTEESIFDLKDKKLLEAAHKQKMDVHYWTINDQKTMKKLIELEADGILTDRPDLLLELLSK